MRAILAEGTPETEAANGELYRHYAALAAYPTYAEARTLVTLRQAVKDAELVKVERPFAERAGRIERGSQDDRGTDSRPPSALG